MHIHILGICGTFMGGIASLAVEKGYRVTGSDENVYPPMSTQLEAKGIVLQEGYKAAHLQPRPDKIIVGNALKRGNEVVEYMLNEGLPYQSGPQWLAENVLREKWVIAVAGTHGKTTTSSMIAWILTYAGLEPGFLIGGIPANFGVSAKGGHDPFFVVEADEYDCAFFDKRSKFIHYHPRTCVLNNLEFDHADIFENIEEIKKQFHHLIRTIPGQAAIITAMEPTLQSVLAMGCWSETQTFGLQQGEWQAVFKKSDGSVFEVSYQGNHKGTVAWSLIGAHNVHNALGAVAASVHAGVPPHIALEALCHFQSVKRRMEVRGVVNGITVYDDFAHHPTAIQTTIEGLRAKVGTKRLIAVLDIRSNTLCMGTHREALAAALQDADLIFIYQSSKVTWDVAAHLQSLGSRVSIYTHTQAIIEALAPMLRTDDHVLIMSNGGFDQLHQQLLERLNNTELTTA